MMPVRAQHRPSGPPGQPTAQGRSSLERRILAALEAAPSRIPLVLGGCGTGRTQALYRLRDRLGRSACQYVNVERSATTPERFLHAIVAASPFRALDGGAMIGNAREAFEATLAFLDSARLPGGEPATFLLDEVLELRTFESFPGLRRVLGELLPALAASGNHFVLTTRYAARASRLMRDAAARFELMPVAPMTPLEIHDLLGSIPGGLPADAAESEYLARAVHALADGRAGYARAIAEMMALLSEGRGAGDPVSALAALLAPDGGLFLPCCFCYELRLHRARGYGALKAILEILAQEEPLTLTEIARRLHRTPGSTKDYLSWLEDVDLVSARQKRYSFSDPVLRLWVRLHCRPFPPAEDEVAREVQGYAAARLPHPEPAMAMAGGGSGGIGDAEGGERKPWGIIEID